MARYIYTLLLLFVSTCAYAQVDTTLYDSMDDDPRYVELCDEHSLLSEREDSLRLLIAEVREGYLDAVGSVGRAGAENYALRILNLERELFDIRSRNRDVVRGIALVEQRYIINDIYSGVRDNDEDDYDNVRGDNTEHAQLVHNAIIARSLSAGSYADLKQAQHEDELLPNIVDEYIANYARIGRCVRAYNIATSEQEGDAIYDNYLVLRDRADSLGGLIDRYWSHVLNAKYYAYGYILERYGLYDLLDNSSTDFSNMQQVCANEDGKYQLDALAHYALGRSTLVAFERDFANEMGLLQAADSLQRVYNSAVQPNYRLEPLSIERRLFVEYDALKFGSKEFYNDANPIPEVKVYQRGTIYRVLLGVFRNKQASSLFKGVQPLYVTKDAEGYSYYAAGYATEEEAEEAVDILLEKGFKEPQICCWRDGKMRNLSEPEPESAAVESAQSGGQRYIVLLETNAITESMRNTITMVAPDKRISRRGASFAIGTFTERSDAENVQTALMENHPNVEVSVVELNIQ